MALIYNEPDQQVSLIKVGPLRCPLQLFLSILI